MICKFTACPKSNGTMFDAIGKGASAALLVDSIPRHAEYLCKLFCAESSEFFIWNLHIASIDGLGSRVIPADASTSQKRFSDFSGLGAYKHVVLSHDSF